MYQIVTIAIHSETREEMVVYQALYGDYSVYCRPLSMFMSEVDREKYPDVEQRFRFEKVDRAEKADTDDSVEVTKTTKTENEVDNEISEAGKMSDEKKMTSAPKFKVDTSYERSEVMEKSIDDEARDLNLDPLVIKFLDADLASEKNDILCKLHPIITNDMIDIMAMSVGVVINEGDVDGRYNDLRNCLTTMEKYESTRLRS
ncbi:DUF1653 domain-containing protein [Butyrivibrio sp. AE2005]|uniref:DUF1653 domain-containing protein n=1 Tax=Butyrivibrio sp. AE2005 TaxID=1496722 RepID=UPI0009DF0A6A